MNDIKATIAAYSTGIGTAVLGWVFSNPAGAIGAICALGTFLVNWYYKSQHLKLAQAAAEREE